MCRRSIRVEVKKANFLFSRFFLPSVSFFSSLILLFLLLNFLCKPPNHYQSATNSSFPSVPKRKCAMKKGNDGLLRTPLKKQGNVYEWQNAPSPVMVTGLETRE